MGRSFVRQPSQFMSHIDAKVQMAQTARIQIKGLTKMHGLVTGLVGQILFCMLQ